MTPPLCPRTLRYVARKLRRMARKDTDQAKCATGDSSRSWFEGQALAENWYADEFIAEARKLESQRKGKKR